MMNRSLKVVSVLIPIALILGATSTAHARNRSALLAMNTNTMSPDGIHWHVHLKIVINGHRKIIPANVGIGPRYARNPQYDPMMQMTNEHTHDASGWLHWEIMTGPVRKADLRLGLFFDVWNKRFNKSCIFQYCNSGKATVKMFVNGKENFEFENYRIRDRDLIEIRYE